MSESDDLLRRKPRAGSSVQDLCRACKLVRLHTVMVADTDGTIHRVVCDYCGSQHNYRGGGPSPRSSSGGGGGGSTATRKPFPVVSERERSAPPMQSDDIEGLLRKILREEGALTSVIPADKWHDGELVLRPGREGVQEKSWPIETFFTKIVMLRNRLRTMEQQINASDLPNETKIKIQGYITACYGSLTSFNVLFADDDDRFRGAGGKS